MEIIKKVIKYLFNLVGIQIVNIDGYNAQQVRISEIISTANKFYKESLQCRFDNLTEPEYLQFLELKYGGYITDVSTTILKSDAVKLKGVKHTGGDRMNVFFNNYSEKYSHYLEPLRHSKKTIHSVTASMNHTRNILTYSI